MQPVEAAIRHFTDNEDVDLDQYEVDERGEHSIVVLCPEPYHEVLKISRGPQDRWTRSKVMFESFVLEKLEAAPQPPPLPVPNLVECASDAKPYYFAMQRMWGEDIGLVEAARMSDGEKSEIGTAIGRFAAWMATSISGEAYSDILWDSGASLQVMPDREKIVRRYVGGYGSSWLEDNGYTALSVVLYSHYEEYRRLQRDGRLRPTIIGHDDLSVINMKMKIDDAGMRTPTGVFDFESTKPTSPERELRYAWAMGRIAGMAAKAAYELETNVELDENLLRFWAVGQRITNAVFSVNQSEPYGGSEHLTAIAHELAWLEPYEDWSEIEADDFSNRKGDRLFTYAVRPGVYVYDPPISRVRMFTS